MHQLELQVMTSTLAVCQLRSTEAVPPFPAEAEFFCAVRSASETSVICSEALVPTGAKVESGWRAMFISSPLDFTMIGILSMLLSPLTAAGIGIMTVSTYNTDYIFVKQRNLDRTVEIFKELGHTVRSVE